MTNQPSLALRSPDDVLALVLTVFGFHPSDSLVLVTRTDVASFHARVDLPPGADPEVLLDLADYLTVAAGRNGAREAALVAYTADHHLATTAVAAVAASLSGAGVPAVLRLREHAGFWYPAGDDPGPVLGSAYDLQDHPLLLQRTFDDREIYADRSALADSLRGSEEELAAVDAELDPAADRLLAQAEGGPLLDAVREYLIAESAWLEGRLRPGADLADAEVARLCLAVSFVEARDRAWAKITPETARGWADTWKAIVRRVPDTVVAPPASLLAFAAWLAGDGALAWCAVDLARSADPGYSLAGLIAQALEAAVPPSAWTPPTEFSQGHKAG